MRVVIIIHYCLRPTKALVKGVKLLLEFYDIVLQKKDYAGVECAEAPGDKPCLVGGHPSRELWIASYGL